MNTYTTTASGYHEQMTDLRRQIIRSELERAGWHRTRAARALGLRRTYLLRLIRNLGLRADLPASPDLGGQRSA